MSDPLHVTSSHRSAYKHQPVPALDRPPTHTQTPPSKTKPSLDDHAFSSSPPSEDGGYLSSSPDIPQKMKMPSSEGKGLNRHTRHIAPRRKNSLNDADAEEASGFEGHSKIATFPPNHPQTPLKRSATGEKYSSHRSPTLPKKKGSKEDHTPIPIKNAKAHANSALDLYHPDVPYRRVRSEMSIRPEKTAYPITSEIRDMHIYSLAELKSPLDRLKFHSDEAAFQLFNSYEYYEESRGTIIEGLVDLRRTLYDWQLKRFDAVLTMVLSNKGGEEFINAYMTAIGDPCVEEVPSDGEIPSKKKGSAYLINSNIREMHIYSLAELKSAFDRFKFHSNEAASQLFDSYEHYEESREAIIQGLVDLRRIPLDDWQLKRFYTVLTIVLCTKGSGEFISAYMAAVGDIRMEEISSFARHAIEILSKKKTSANILASIARITRHEIKTQMRDTLFRETNLSSTLCREYGKYIWHKELNELVKTIKRALPEKDLPSLSLKYDTVQKQLTEKGNTADNLEHKLDENAERFIAFARTALPKIFELSVPTEFKELLIARRRQIIRFLIKNPDRVPEDPQITSRIFISEVLYLRLLNTYLMTKDPLDRYNHVLGSLCRVIQSLAAEIPFGTEQHDPIYQRLNPLFDEFIEDHRRFVDDNSLRSLDDETEPEEIFV